jgi:ketosteroid isomerase-like protein
VGKGREAAERYYGLFAAGDFPAATALFAPGCATVTPAGSMDPAQHEAFARAFKAGLPDARMELVRAVESGDEVFIEGRFVGTHTGDLVTPQGTLPASGNRLEMPYADYFRVDGGKVVDRAAVPSHGGGVRSPGYSAFGRRHLWAAATASLAPSSRSWSSSWCSACWAWSSPAAPPPRPRAPLRAGRRSSAPPSPRARACRRGCRWSGRLGPRARPG